MIKKKGNKYVLMNKDGTRKLFESTSYQAVVNREREIEYFKQKARDKKAGKVNE